MVDNIHHFVQCSLSIKGLTLRRLCVRSRIRFGMRSIDYISFNGILDNG